MDDLKFRASEGEFVLKDIVYDITDSFVGVCSENMEIFLFPEINAETDDEDVEYDMNYVRLYHNNGFNTHISNFDELKGKSFVWDSEYNSDGEEAGFLYVQEHEDVTKGTIEILDVKDGSMTIKWSGLANVFWDEKYGENVPFETVFSASLPERMTYSLNTRNTVKMKIDEQTRLEILNLEQFEEEVTRVSATRQWDDFNTTLDFKLTYADSDYLGVVIFTNGKNNHMLVFDENCPKKVNFKDVGLEMGYEIFYFEVE